MNADPSIAPTPSAPPPPTFDALALSPELRRAIDEMGFTQPTPVQLATFEPAGAGSDLIVQARTGTGKTAAFGLPLIDKRVSTDGGQQVLILAPTRELALQSAREIEKLGKHKNIRTAAVYGGAPMEKQVRELQEGAQIVSGTPGRVLDHLRRGTLRGENLRVLILDEADEMLSMGFAKELNSIVELLPKNRQTMLFSATLDDAVQRLATKLMRDPVRITLSSDAVGALGISHFVYTIPGVGKSRDLIRILEIEDPESAIIFCNTKAVTEQVAAELQHAGFQADWLNGDLPQNEREQVLARTRKGQLRYLVATDVAARGIDISHLTHVINFDFPDHIEAYVHRTGRTGRAGKTGTAISLITPQDLGALYYVRLSYKIFPIERSLPSAGEVKARKELDRIELLSEAFAGEPGTNDRAIARRLLVHDDAERIIGGLLHAFLGARDRSEEDADEQAAAARRARAARPAGPALRALEASERAESERGPKSETEKSEPQKTEPREPREPRDRGPRTERNDRPPRPVIRSRLDSPPVERAPVLTAPAPDGAVADESATSPGMDAIDDDEQRARRRRRRDPAAPSRDRDADPSPAQLSASPATAEGPPDRMEEPTSPATGDGSTEGDPSMSTIFVNLGRRDGVRVGDVIRLFETHAAMTKDDLGRIRIRDRHTFVGVKKERLDHVLASLAGKMEANKEIVVEVARAEQAARAPAEPVPQS